MAVTPDGLRCQSRAPNWQGCRATKAVHGGGKYYYEATVTDEGLCRVGWSLADVIITTSVTQTYDSSCMK